MVIAKCEKKDYEVLAGIWERSVRATHNFLSEEDFRKIRAALIPEYFPNVALYTISDGDSSAGFIGLRPGKIEMLFIDNDKRGCGYGSALVAFAKQKGATRADVNEQNSSALSFYIGKGFHIVGKDNTDEAGRPYPILHLAL